MKIYVGKITNYNKTIRIAELLPEANTVKVNDEIMIIGPTTGVIQSTVTEIRVDDKNVEESPRKFKCSIPISRLVRPSDKLYKVIDASKIQTQ